MKWDDMFERFCKSNEDLGKILEYVIIGQNISTTFKWLGGVDQKPRLHIMVIDLSGTGKNQSTILVQMICKKLGLKFDEYTDSTEAGLVGTIQKAKVKGEEVNVERRGLMDTYNIIAFTEAESLFKGSYKETMIKTLQNAMDEPGKVNKALSSGVLSYPTKTSFLLLSTPFPRFDNILLSSGLLQRCILFLGNKNSDDIMDTSKIIDNDIIKGTKSIEMDIEENVNKLKELTRSAKECMTFDSNCTEYMKTFDEKIYNYLNSIGDSTKRDTFSTYIPRAKNNLYKLAVIDAVKNKEEIVECHNFKNVERFIFIHLDGIFNAIKKVNNDVRRLNDESRFNIIKHVLKSNVEVKGTTSLRNKLVVLDTWDIGLTTTYKFLQLHENKFNVIKDGNTKIWKGE